MLQSRSKCATSQRLFRRNTARNDEEFGIRGPSNIVTKRMRRKGAIRTKDRRQSSLWTFCAKTEATRITVERPSCP